MWWWCIWRVNISWITKYCSPQLVQSPSLTKASFCQNGTFIATEEPYAETSNHPWFIVYLEFTPAVVHSMGLDKCLMMCSSLQYHKEYFNCLENSHSLPYHSLPKPWQPLIFLVSSLFCLSRRSCSSNHRVYSLFNQPPFTS